MLKVYKNLTGFLEFLDIIIKIIMVLYNESKYKIKLFTPEIFGGAVYDNAQ